MGLGGIYREVLDTALLTSGPEAERGAGMVTMDTAEVGLVTMDTGLGLVRGAGWGGRKQTGVAGVRGGGRPGAKGRAVRFRTPPGLELKFMLGLGLGSDCCGIRTMLALLKPKGTPLARLTGGGDRGEGLEARLGLTGCFLLPSSSPEL